MNIKKLTELLEKTYPRPWSHTHISPHLEVIHKVWKDGTHATIGHLNGSQLDAEVIVEAVNHIDDFIELYDIAEDLLYSIDWNIIKEGTLDIEAADRMTILLEKIRLRK